MNRKNRIVEEAWNIAMNMLDEGDSSDPKQDIIAGLEGMKPGAVLQLVSKTLGTSSSKFLATHLVKILVDAAKSGKVKFDAIKDAVKDFDKKNIEDDSNIDWEHVEIDPAGTSMKCFFDGDSKKIIDNFMKEYEKEMKDVKKEIDETDKKLHDDVKKAGVKIDDEKLDKNGIIVASVIDDTKNKDKSGKELTKEVDLKISQNEEAKELIKLAKESEKKLAQIKVDPKIETMSDEEIAKAVEDDDKKNASKGQSSAKTPDSIVKDVDKKLTAKLGKDYKQSLITGVYSKEELSKTAKKNKLGKVDFSSIKSNKILGVRIDFFGDESADVIKEVVDDKAGFAIRKVDSSEKDAGVKKVYETFSKFLKNTAAENIEGDVIAFLKHWEGKNEDGNFDSLFMFVGLKDDTANESMSKMSLNEKLSKEPIDHLAVSFFNCVKKLGKSSSLLRHEAARLWEVWVKKYIEDKGLKMSYSDMLKVASGKMTSGDEALDGMCSIFSELKDDNPKEVISNCQELLKDKDLVNAYGNDFKKAISYASKFKGNDVFSIDADFGAKNVTADAISNGIEKGASRNASDVTNGFAVFSDGTTRPTFNYLSMTKNIDDLEKIFDDGQVSSAELEKFQKMGDRLTRYTVWAEENKDSTNADIQNKIALIKRMQSKYDVMTLNHGDELTNAGAFDSPRIINDNDGIPNSQAKSVSKSATSAENDEDAQKASKGWKKALGLDKAFTAIGIARLIAKSTGIVLNHGKAVIDMAGKQAMKYKEDKNIIAEFRITLTNGKESKSKFDDTKFAVRFDVEDCKWHATCLDNRKMKFPEDKLIKAALDSEVGKKFKQYCLTRWKSIFAPEDERMSIIPFILKNELKIGSKKLPEQFVNNIRKMSDRFSTIEAALK